MGGEAGGGGRHLVGRSGGVRVEEDRVERLRVRRGRERPGKGGVTVGPGRDGGGGERAGPELQLRWREVSPGARTQIIQTLPKIL